MRFSFNILSAVSLVTFAWISSAANASATTVFSIDTSCNPTVDPPSSGGCTWENFYETAASGLPDGSTGQPTGTGSSFTNYYVAAGAAQWTIADTTDYFTLRVLDGGHVGDTFNVYDNGVLLGATSAATVNTSYTCGNDPTFSGTDPAECWNDPLMSRGTFLLTPNASGHSINILWLQQVPGGDSNLQWFEVNTASNPVPEPAATALVGLGLVALLFLRRPQRALL